jgi:hypothetical protein
LKAPAKLLGNRGIRADYLAHAQGVVKTFLAGERLVWQKDVTKREPKPASTATRIINTKARPPNTRTLGDGKYMAHPALFSWSNLSSIGRWWIQT